MNFELTGTLTEVFDTQNITDTFQKRDIVVETSTTDAQGKEYFETIKFQLTQDRCDLISDFGIGEEITVHFNIKGSKWDKGDKPVYFVNLDAWRLESTSTGGQKGGQEGGQKVQEDEVPNNDVDPDQDLPFIITIFLTVGSMITMMF